MLLFLFISSGDTPDKPNLKERPQPGTIIPPNSGLFNRKGEPLSDKDIPPGVDFHKLSNSERQELLREMTGNNKLVFFSPEEIEKMKKIQQEMVKQHYAPDGTPLRVQRAMAPPDLKHPELDGPRVPIPCYAPNTMQSLDKLDECICLPGFNTTHKRVDTDGCWKCQTPCHEHATCVSMNKCQCDDGYIGNGFEICDLIPLTIVNFEPSQCHKIDCVVNISFKLPSGVNRWPDMVYCKVGEIVNVAETMEPGIVGCFVPPQKTTSVDIAISPDGETWFNSSSPYVVVSVRSSISPFYFLSVIFLFVAVVYFGGTRMLKQKAREIEALQEEEKEQLFKHGPLP